MSKLSEKYAGKVSAREEKKIQKAMEEQKFQSTHPTRGCDRNML